MQKLITIALSGTGDVTVLDANTGEELHRETPWPDIDGPDVAVREAILRAVDNASLLPMIVHARHQERWS